MNVVSGKKFGISDHKYPFKIQNWLFFPCVRFKQYYGTVFGGFIVWELVIRSTRISETDLVFEISFCIRLKPFFTLPLTVKSRNNTFFHQKRHRKFLSCDFDSIRTTDIVLETGCPRRPGYKYIYHV